MSNANALTYEVPTVTAPTVTLVLNPGSAYYALTVADPAGTVAVYLSYAGNRELMSKVSAAITHLDTARTPGELSVETLGGVVYRGQPAGLIRVVLEPVVWSTTAVIALVIEDGSGATATAHVDRVGACELIEGAALMTDRL